MQIFYPEVTWISGINTLIVSWVTKIHVGHNWVHPSHEEICLLKRGRHLPHAILLHLPLGKKEAMEIFFAKTEQSHLDLSARNPRLVFQQSLTIFADGTALIRLIHWIHALGLGTSWHSAQHFSIGFTATLLTRRNLKHKSTRLLILSCSFLDLFLLPF